MPGAWPEDDELDEVSSELEIGMGGFARNAPLAYALAPRAEPPSPAARVVASGVVWVLLVAPLVVWAWWRHGRRAGRGRLVALAALVARAPIRCHHVRARR